MANYDYLKLAKHLLKIADNLESQPSNQVSTKKASTNKDAAGKARTLNELENIQWELNKQHPDGDELPMKKDYDPQKPELGMGQAFEDSENPDFWFQGKGQHDQLWGNEPEMKAKSYDEGLKSSDSSGLNKRFYYPSSNEFKSKKKKSAGISQENILRKSSLEKLAKASS